MYVDEPYKQVTDSHCQGIHCTCVHDSQGQDTSLCMTPRARIPHCAWLPGPGYIAVHDSLGQDTWLHDSEGLGYSQ